MFRHSRVVVLPAGVDRCESGLDIDWCKALALLPQRTQLFNDRTYPIDLALAATHHKLQSPEDQDGTCEGFKMAQVTLSLTRQGQCGLAIRNADAGGSEAQASAAAASGVSSTVETPSSSFVDFAAA